MTWFGHTLFCYVLFCCDRSVANSCGAFTLVFQVVSLALCQSYGCPVVSGVTLKDVGIICQYLSTTNTIMMTSSNENIFRVTGPLCREFTSHCCEIALRWMPQNITYETAILVFVMTCCRQPISHYLSQRWPRSMSPYVVTKQQCVKRQAITCPSADPGEWRIYVSRIWENFKHWYFPKALFLNPAKTTQICDTCVWFRYQQVICLVWAFALICGAGHMVFKTMGILCDCCAFRDLSMPFDMIWMRHEAMIIVTYILIIVHRYELKAVADSGHVENCRTWSSALKRKCQLLVPMTANFVEMTIFPFQGYCISNGATPSRWGVTKSFLH